MHNEATMLVTAVFIGSCVASPMTKARFQFVLPGKSTADNVELNTTSAFNRQCYRFIYAVAPTHLDEEMGTNIKGKVRAQCAVKDETRCNAWSSSLTDLFAAKNALKKKHLRKQKGAPTYTQWCESLYKAATSPAGAAETAAKEVKSHAVSQESKSTQKAKARSAATKSVASTAVGKRSSVPSGHPSKALVSQHSEVNEQSPVKATKASSKTTAATPKAKNATNATKQPDNKGVADNIDPDLCACVHRDGKKLCHCRKPHTHSRPAQATAPVIAKSNTTKPTANATNKVAATKPKPVPVTAVGKRSSVPKKARSQKAQSSKQTAASGQSTAHSTTIAKHMTTATTTAAQKISTSLKAATTTKGTTTTTTKTTTKRTTTTPTSTTPVPPMNDVAAQSELVPGLENLKGAEGMLNGVLSEAEE